MARAVDEILVEQILENPADPSPYLVYGDWLQDRGDPRGRLIAAQAARLATPQSAELAALEARILAEHRDALLGPSLDIEPAPAVEWHLGFWRALRIGGFGWSAKPTRGDHVAALLAHPSARFLRELAIDGALSQDVLAHAATRHRTLERLDVALRDHLLDDRGLAALAGCTRLEQLALFSCEHVTSAGLAALAPLRRLRTLDLRNHPLDDAGVAHLVELPLAEVKFNAVSRGLTARGMRGLAALPLHVLALDGETLDDTSIVPLAEHPTLANLELAGARFGPGGLAALGSLPKLRRLYLPSSSLDDAALRQLAPLADRPAGAGLRALFVGHCETLSDRCCATIGRFRELVYLDLSATQITGGGLAQLRDLRDLEHLDLGFLDLDDAAVATLRGFPRLTALSLVYSGRVGDAAVDMLADLPALEQLDLGGTSITPAAIDRLARLPRLTALGLMDCAPEVIEHARTFAHWYVTTRDSLELGFGTDA